MRRPSKHAEKNRNRAGSQRTKDELALKKLKMSLMMRAKRGFAASHEEVRPIHLVRDYVTEGPPDAFRSYQDYKNEKKLMQN